ncbi:MAG: flagellar export chaperone FliS [Fibrobacterota bacterium]
MPSKPTAQIYRESDIKTAGKLKSLLLLFDRALVLLHEARDNEKKRGPNIVKVQNILAQFEHSLDFESGGLAGDLFFLYDYLFEELQRRDERAIDTALRMVGDLRTAFAAVCRKPE